MDDLRAMAVFAETVDAGSMSGAARRLGTSPSAVSQTIRALEVQGGVTLLHRSTRKLTLTDAGERYYTHCKRLVEAGSAATESLRLARDAPTGELRISAPVGFARHIAPALAPLLSEAPQLRLRLLVDDAMIDLIDARIDVALRVGNLAASGWVARRLCDFEMILCASPGYLERHTAPSTPEELTAHQWFALELESKAETSISGVSNQSGTVTPQPRGHDRASNAVSQSTSMRLELRAPDGQHQCIHIDPRIVSNNLIALQQMCEHGLGIARFARADVSAALRSGVLIQVLAQWRLEAIPIWALTPKREGEEAKIRAALDHLKRYFATIEQPG